MMLSSSLHVLDREGYIDRFDIPGRRVRGTRLLKPEVRGPQLKLDAAQAAGKGAPRSREIEADGRLRLCAELPATGDPALLRRSRSGALRQLRYLPGDRGTFARARRRTKRSSFERR